MLIYWLLLAIPAAGAFMFTSEERRAELPASKVLLALFVIYYAVVAGLRHQTGGDWETYWSMTEAIRGASLPNALAAGDMGFEFVSYVSLKLGWGLYGINLFCALVLVLGCVRLAWRTPAPWIAMAAAVPYILVVIGMGYIRQAAAIGFILLAMVNLIERGWVRGVIYFAVAILMHVAAVVVIPVLAVAASRRQPLLFLPIAAVGVAAYVFVLAGTRLEQFQVGYLDQAYSSSGATIRVMMNAVPAAMYLYARRFLAIPKEEKFLWTLVSWVSLLLIVLLFVSPSSTAVDRAALFFAPLQIFVFGYFIQMMRGGGRMNSIYILLALVYQVGVQWVWLFFAQHSFLWVPYKSILADRF